MEYTYIIPDLFRLFSGGINESAHLMGSKRPLVSLANLAECWQPSKPAAVAYPE